MRVHAISWRSAAKPDSPSTAAARARRRGGGAALSTRIDWRPPAPGVRRGSGVAAGLAPRASDLAAPRPAAQASAADNALAATPQAIDRETPSRGISRKPAASAPAAAPSVLVAYSIAVRRVRAGESLANQRMASGKVAPSAMAGSSTSPIARVTRMSGKAHPGAPS